MEEFSREGNESEEKKLSFSNGRLDETVRGG